jgi:hypothetical protein
MNYIPMNTVVACGSIKPELEKMAGEAVEKVHLHFLPQNLHRAPHKMKEMIQKAIDEKSSVSERIVLGYGLCSNGIVGVKAPQQGLYVPKVHDCIAFYLGSREKYNKIFRQHPGTYHLTKSWIDNEKDPLGLMENEYTRRVGEEMAKEAIETEIKNYEYISFINNELANSDKYRQRAKKNAEVFHKKYIEYKGTDSFFKKILFGPYDKDFIYIEPNKTIKQKEFLK